MWAVAVTGSVSLLAALISAVSAGATGTLQYVLTVPIPFMAAGIFLLWRHPDHLAGRWLVLGTAFSMAYSVLLERFIVTTLTTDGVQLWMSWALIAEALLSSVGLACLALLIGLFPRGFPETAGERRYFWALWYLPLPMLVAQLANDSVLIDAITYGQRSFDNPIFIEPLAWLGPATAPIRYLLASVLLVAIGLLIVRYRRAAAGARRQIRWVLFGSAAALAIGIFPFVVLPFLMDTMSALHGGIALTLGSIALLLIPVTVVLAVEQPPWLDTDTVIRRSFTYGALSVGIFVVYAAVAAGFGLAAGARLPVEIAIAITVLMALAFQPARLKLQEVADRWVFGDQPTPIEAVADFDRSMSLPESGTALAEHLADTTRRAARLSWVTVDLPPDRPFTSGSRSNPPALTVPIDRGDESFGTIESGPKVRGQLKDSDRDLVRALASQAALVVSNARLAARIVQAQEAERRRLERNIHDGAQQELVALVAKLGVARAKAKNQVLDEAMLIELQRDAGTILKDLRALAQGIHPSVLTDGGLVEAVEDRCSRLPINVRVEASPWLRRHRFDDNVEGAAYFFVTESLTNVLKHADATEAEVRIQRANGHLVLRVSDNGVGFDPSRVNGHGLTGLTDRFTALAGSVMVDTAPGRGTTLEGRIPVETVQ